MSTEESTDQQSAVSATNAEITSPQEPLIDLMMEAPDSPPDFFAPNHSFTDTPNTTPSRSAQSQDKVNHGAPGSSWNSKKFREDYDRVWDGLMDKNWDGKTKYGDPLIKN
ncbi:hypothetical protein SBOR_6005 [Sclerotinia borealis F-4128]|uniref:Uncharacterized protein n=1 Tax=Sclerotinia borealis (strain F-4128) TaxID=1432307 RepID=W9CA38_SCLBF|nr:hypothetical protein SBOR_6005 [Sclerotinia borealis F-4128]